VVLESFPNLHPVVFLQSIGLELIISSRTLRTASVVRLSFDLVASFIFFDFDRSTPYCRFGWDSSNEGFPAMPIRMGSSDSSDEGFPAMLIRMAFLRCRLSRNADSDGIFPMAFLTESSVNF
jgi:hypothetical protein